MGKKELLAVYIQENEIARDRNTDAKILGAVEYAHLIGVIDDDEHHHLVNKYQKLAIFG